MFNAYQVDESYLGVSPAFSSGAGNNHDLNGVLLNYTFEKKLSDEIEINAQATFDHNQRILSRSFDDNTKSDVTGQRISGILNFLFSPNDALGFNAGIEYAIKKSLNYDNINVQQDNVLTENNMKDKSVYDYSFFGQGEYNISSFTFLAGLRYNQNEFFGGNISTRGTMVYEVNDKNSIKLVYGSSYRAPSLFEIYFKTPTNTVLGNKDLDPEESTSFEISYLTAFGNFFVQALAYHAEYTNKIFRTKGNFTTEDGTVFNNVNYYTNGNKFNSSGFEIEIKYQDQNSFDAFLNYGFINGNSGDEINGDGHYNFKYVPEHTISGGLSKQFGSFNLSGIINFISERGSINENLDAQITVDLNIGYSHKVGIFSLRHNISAKNVLDELVLYPEYVSRALNSVPSGFGRQLLYSMNVEL